MSAKVEDRASGVECIGKGHAWEQRFLCTPEMIANDPALKVAEGFTYTVCKECEYSPVADPGHHALEEVFDAICETFNHRWGIDGLCICCGMSKEWAEEMDRMCAENRRWLEVHDPEALRRFEEKVASGEPVMTFKVKG